MSVDHFPEALAFTLQWEGGYSDVPGDHGGATNYGITQAVYDDWRRASGQPPQPVREIEMVTVQNIYRERYWKPAGCDGLDRRLAMAVFDCAVNNGVGRAKEFFQAAGAKDQALGVLQGRATFYERIVERDPSQRKFLKGWLNRNNALIKAIGPPLAS